MRTNSHAQGGASYIHEDVEAQARLLSLHRTLPSDLNLVQMLRLNRAWFAISPDRRMELRVEAGFDRMDSDCTIRQICQGIWDV